MGYWIVVVDDNTIDLKVAKSILSDQDMRISCLRSGKDLLKFMESHEPDLVLLDITMPDMDGFEAFRAMRSFEEEHNRSATPVIFLSGGGDSATERRGLKDGASDFIRKPFDKDILLHRIANTIENNKTIKALTQKATLDKLTGFLNKTSGTERITDMCQEKTGAIMLLDLDNFKLVNDIYGHDAGDKVLISFSEIVRHNTREGDVISRIGGDEFLAFFCDLTSKVAVKALTDRLNEQLLKQCVEIMGADFDIPIGISIGVAFVPEHSRDFSMLFRFVDSSMYRVKQNGKHGVHIHDEEAFDEDSLATSDLDMDMTRFNRILKERSSADGAMVLGKDTFIQVYRFAVRFLERDKSGALKILFSLGYDDYQMISSQEASDFIELLQKSLRKSDVIVQIKSDQFFVFMPIITQEEGSAIIANIEKEFADSNNGSIHLSHVENYISYE
jgi:diguanylate cyclase (GGDEF)-like protein